MINILAILCVYDVVLVDDLDTLLFLSLDQVEEEGQVESAHLVRIFKSLLEISDVAGDFLDC